MEGLIKSVVEKKRFGFIRADGKEYFFHQDDCMCDWRVLCKDFDIEGDGNIKVSFKPITSPKGPRAQNVERI